MNNNIKQLFSLMLIASLSGCGVFSKFESPKLEDANIAGDKITLNETPLADIPSWREYFVDEKLQTLIECALVSNADLQTVRLNITQAQRSLASARLAYVPQLVLTGEASTTRVGSYTTNSYTVPLTAAWEIDLFGRIRNSKKQAAAVLEQTKLYEKCVQSQIVAAVAVNYYALILSDMQLSLSRESLSLMSESIETLKALKEVGALNEAAIVQAEASYQSIIMGITSLEHSIEITSNNLNLLLNRTPQLIERSPAIIGSNINLDNSLSISALSSRPDVLYSEAKLCQSFYGVNYARSSMYPSLSISASVGVTAGEMLLNALGSLTAPIFMANSRRANLENAKDQYEQNLIAFNLTLLTAGKEVNDALWSIENSAKRYDIAQKQDSSLSRAVEITKDLMQSGKVNYLEVLTAQNSYLASRLDLSNIEYERAIANISLYTALGGGVD